MTRIRIPRIRVFPYKQGSRSARALADALGGRVLRLEGSTYRYREGDLLIGWGASETPFLAGYNTRGLAQASNKLTAFNLMQAAGVRVPRFWTSRDEIPEDVRYPIVCRTVLNGHSGRGIVLADTADQIVDAPLYVEYFPKAEEYRIHVVGDRVIARQRKARRLDVADENVNWRIRNHDNGFIFARDNVNPPQDVELQAIAAVQALGLDFGAVDIGWNERRQQAAVFEVNTAPGLEGETVNDYAEAFRNLIRA